MQRALGILVDLRKVSPTLHFCGEPADRRRVRGERSVGRSFFVQIFRRFWEGRMADFSSPFGLTVSMRPHVASTR
jgi:hypothetical protein